MVLVLAEAARVAEGLEADVALVRPLPRVEAGVLLQVVLVLEGLGAHGARVRSLVCRLVGSFDDFNYHIKQARSETANIGRFGQIWVFGLEYVKLNFQLNGHLILGP